MEEIKKEFKKYSLKLNLNIDFKEEVNLFLKELINYISNMTNYNNFIIKNKYLKVLELKNYSNDIAGYYSNKTITLYLYEINGKIKSHEELIRNFVHELGHSILESFKHDFNEEEHLECCVNFAKAFGFMDKDKYDECNAGEVENELEEILFFRNEIKVTYVRELNGIYSLCTLFENGRYNFEEDFCDIFCAIYCFPEIFKKINIVRINLLCPFNDFILKKVLKNKENFVRCFIEKFTF